MKRTVSIFLIMIFMFGLSLPAFAQENDGEGAKSAETVDIWVWASNIKQGAQISEKSLKKITVAKENTPSNVVVDSKKLIDEYAVRNLHAGEYASLDQISKEAVRKANFEVLRKPITPSDKDYVFVTDYIVPNTGDDLSFFLQEIIDKNPNRTIYFPDGVYTIASPIFTSAVSKDTVSIQLSDGAVIKAADNWRNRDGRAMICIGGAAPMNNIKNIGSYYIISGGTVDGNGRANGIIINSGRETVVRNICIKNTIKGIMIDHGANNGSADCDFEDITIIGNGMPGTIGMHNKAHDNTYTNVRIYDMATGFLNERGGEIANIYVAFTERSSMIKKGRIGINSRGRISHCVTVNCDTGFQLYGDVIAFDCTAVWTADSYKKQNAFYSKKPLVLSGCKAFFCEGDGVKTSFAEGTDYFEGCFMNNKIIEKQ